MKKIILAGLVFFMASPSMAENYLLNGGQESRIQYQMVQQIYPSSNIRKLVLNYVHPGSFNSPTYNQEITDLKFSFSPPPGKRSEITDKRGNKVIEVVWEAPFQPITATTSLTAKNQVKLKPLQTQALFPLSKLPEDVQVYLKATQQANSDNIQIQEKELTK